MPIPTRSVPGRDPRKQPPTVGRTTTNLKPPSAATQSTEDIPSKIAPSTLPTRRQSLVRPSQSKPPSSTKSTTLTTNTRTVGRGPSSPIKQNDAVRQQNRRSPSPKKTDMPPPPRPSRSASLRQTSSLNSGTQTAPRGHARHRSQVVTPASGHAPKAPQAPQAPQTPSTATTPRSRNQFTAYQQQFSPKKTPKPPTPTPSASAAPDRTSSLIPSSWPEIAALQTELLQLNLLHKSWGQQNAEWERDAEAQLRSKYNSVAEDYKAILDVEKDSQRKLNAQALQYWLKNSEEHNGQQGYAEQVRLLSQVAQEVYDVCDSRGGRYTMAILEFENWLQKVELVQDTRFPHGRGQDPGIFINPIDRKWKEEMNALIMKLELASRQLQSLDILGYREVEALDQSALLRMAKGLDELLSLMVEELSTIRRIETDIVKLETARVSQLAQHLIETQPRGLQVNVGQKRLNMGQN
ncbi:hypothetical protein BDW59DRAFT_30544 [Aspergillus cavernicola]|uniref:Uncharacterized protein n=1 Tax=Aspergillus cavernicola TaxID=176166 RepID=A0ABR4HDQ4_9EURO